MATALHTPDAPHMTDLGLPETFEVAPDATLTEPAKQAEDTRTDYQREVDEAAAHYGVAPSRLTQGQLRAYGKKMWEAAAQENWERDQARKRARDAIRTAYRRERAKPVKDLQLTVDGPTLGEDGKIYHTTPAYQAVPVEKVHRERPSINLAPAALFKSALKGIGNAFIGAYRGAQAFVGYVERWHASDMEQHAQAARALGSSVRGLVNRPASGKGVSLKQTKHSDKGNV